MELPVIILLAFAATTTAVAAVGFLVRDLVAGGTQRGDAAMLRRLPLARDERPPQGVVGRIDAGLEQLVNQSGIDCTAMAAGLLLVASGLLLGGGLWCWTQNLLTAAVGGLVGLALPLPPLIFYQRRRMRQMREQFPDLLDLLARAVRAGESLDQAIDLAGKKGPEPLATELRRCAGQLEMGLSMEAAMRSLVHRLRLVEVRILATTLAVHRQMGGNLATALERLSNVLRDRINYRRQVRAATAAGRFSAMLVASAGPLLFAYMFAFQYEYANRLVTMPLGQTLLVVAVALEAIGLVWIIRMLKTD